MLSWHATGTTVRETTKVPAAEEMEKQEEAVLPSMVTHAYSREDEAMVEAAQVVEDWGVGVTGRKNRMLRAEKVVGVAARALGAVATPLLRRPIPRWIRYLMQMSRTRRETSRLGMKC